jgi:anti-anti-sigma regulatory factor
MPTGEISAIALPAAPSALALTQPFVLAGGEAILSGRPRGAELLEAVMGHLQTAPDPSATPLDFSGVSFIDVSCADELLNKLLRRLRSGELGGRYLFLQGANPSVAETIETVLRLRELSVLARQGEEVVVLGDLGRPMREALEVLLQHKALTSGQLAAALGKNTNIVCNRLNALQRLGLACRLPDGTAGGRRYSYVSIL